MSTPAPFAAATAGPSSMGWSCLKCRYAAAMSDGTIQCRFFAPPVTGGNSNATWATVQKTDWCGDYEPAP